MTVQTTYTRTPPIGRAGSVPNGRLKDDITRVVEGAGVAAGLAVIAGTAAHQAKVPAATFTTTFLGVAMEEATATSQSFPATTLINVRSKGPILVAYEPDTVPTPNSPAFVRHTANGAGKLTPGAWRANADSGNAVAAPGAMFRAVYASDGLVELELAGVVN
jgi:hypothetical protein